MERTLEGLPHEVLERIGRELPETSRAALGSTSRRLYSVFGYANVPYWMERLRADPLQLWKALAARPDLYCPVLPSVLGLYDAAVAYEVLIWLLCFYSGQSAYRAALACVAAYLDTRAAELRTLNRSLFGGLQHRDLAVFDRAAERYLRDIVFDWPALVRLQCAPATVWLALQHPDAGTLTQEATDALLQEVFQSGNAPMALLLLQSGIRPSPDMLAALDFAALPGPMQEALLAQAEYDAQAQLQAESWAEGADV